MTVNAEISNDVFNPATLISSELHADLTRRTARDYMMTPDLAERAVNATLVFLTACANNAGTPLHPTGVIDQAWHMFILHTRDYVEFCDRVAGRYLHHTPDDGAKDGGAAVRETVAILRDMELPVDEKLWKMMRDTTNCENACSHYE